jgi:hypothetical protein
MWQHGRKTGAELVLVVGGGGPEGWGGGARQGAV